MLCGDMEYQERVFQIQAEVRSHQTNWNPNTAVHPDHYTDQGRISIIAWGFVDYMEDVD